MILQERNSQLNSGGHASGDQKLMTVAGYLSGRTDVASHGPGHLIEVPPSNEINVAQLRQILQQREVRQRETFRLLLERCYKNIRACAAARKYACAFDVPLFVAGRPLYDVMRCIEYIIRNLTTNGYAVQYSYPRLVLISWVVLQEKQQAAVLSSIARLQELSVSHATAVQKRQQVQEGVEAAEDVQRFAILQGTHSPNTSSSDPIATVSPSSSSSHTRSTPTPTPHVRKPVFKDIAEFKPSGKFVLHI